MSDILYDSQGYRIDMHRTDLEGSGQDAPRGVVITFTSIGFRDLEQPGFAIEALLAAGFDVIAVKSAQDDWFQQLDNGAIATLRTLGRQYARVATLGSGMGAHAALVFSIALNASMVVAVSPQYAVDTPEDRRWAKAARNVTWTRRLTPETAGGAQLTVIYDIAMPEEVAQVEAVLANSAFGDVWEVAVPLSGHPADVTLHQLGMLDATLQAALDWKPAAVPLPSFMAARALPLVLSNLAEFATRQKRPDLAILALRRAVRARPGNMAFRARLSRLYQQTGRRKRAEAESAVLVAGQPAQPDYRALHGQNLLSTGKIDAAIHEFEEAVALAPESLQHRLSLAQTLLAGDRPAEAVPHVQKARALKPKNARALHLYSLALEAMDDLTGAIEQETAAIALDPGKSLWLARLSTLQEQAGNLSRALQAAEQALALAPGKDAFRQQVARLQAVPAASPQAR